MFECNCCSPKKIYKSNKSLRKHQRKKAPVVPLTWFEKVRRDFEIVSPKCNYCSSNLSYQDYKNKKKFCNSSCAASFNGKNRSHTDETKAKIGSALKARPKKDKKPRIMTCQWCDIVFLTLSDNKPKYCGGDCRSQAMSNNRIAFLKRNAGTFNWIPNNTPSYFEKSFMDWLDDNGYRDEYVAQQHFHNDEANTNYFLDIYFDDIKLNIELDGTHHEREQQQKRDFTRDEFLRRRMGIYVHRISIRNYNRKNGRQKCWDDAKQIIEWRARRDSNPQLPN